MYMKSIGYRGVIGILALFVAGVGGGWYGEMYSREGVALAVVDTGRGMCADSADTIAELEAVRQMVLEAETSQELQEAMMAFNAIQTHDQRHLNEARGMAELERRRDRVLGIIEDTREIDDGTYAERLDALEEAALAAETLEDIFIVEEDVRIVRENIGISRPAVAGGGGGGLVGGVTGERAIPGPNVSGGTQCISGSPTLSTSGIYEGCGNSLGTITISGPDILVRDINARSITFRNAERAMVTGARLSGGGVFIADSRNVTFEESTVRNVSGRGMDIRPQNTVGVLVRNVLFSNISRPNCGGAGTADSGAGIAIGHYYRDSLPSVRPNIIIEGSRFENFPDCGDPISAIHIKSNDTVVRNNVVDARMAGIGVRHGRDNQILNNTTTGQSYGIWVMGDNHQVRGNTANVIRIFGGSMTMAEFDQGNHGGGSVYPVARNIRLSGNSVAPRTQCWGSCPLEPTFTVE